MKDIVTRLDEEAKRLFCDGLPGTELPHEAAREIERLRAERDSLRARMNWLKPKDPWAIIALLALAWFWWHR